MYKLNRAYTKKELAEEVFEIKYNTLKNAPEMYMNHLREYFEVREVPNGRHPKYILVKELKPWETYGAKIARLNHTIIEDYRDAADVVITEAPRQTFRSIADKISSYNINNINIKYEHSISTKRQNVSKAVKEYYLPKNAKWCEKMNDGSFRPLSEEEKETMAYLQEKYKEQFYDVNKGEEKFKLMNQLRNGEITEKEYAEADSKLFDSWYKMVMEEFKMAFGFTPIWVKEWERKED